MAVSVYVEHFTIPKLASRLGVTPRAVRVWIEKGEIPRPTQIPATGERFFPSEAADEIERWYLEKAASGGTRGPGAKDRKERARRLLRERGIHLIEPSSSPDHQVEPTPAEIVTAEVRKWLELKDDLLPVVPLVTAVANRLPGPPVWVTIVAPASSGKSQVIQALGAVEGVAHISKVTPRTFTSGLDATDGETSLLIRFQKDGKWLLTLKDLGTLQSLNPNDKSEIYGQLREIYDGKIDSSYGTGKDVNWEGKLGILAGSTPSVDRDQKLKTELGERFLRFWPTTPDREKVADKAGRIADQEEALKAALNRAYSRAFQECLTLLEKDSGFPREEAIQTASALAIFVAEGRCPIWHDRNGVNRFEISEPEGPGRLTKGFQLLLKAAWECVGQDFQTAVQVVTRIGLDTITPRKRGQALRLLARSPEGVTAKTAAGFLRCDENTARRELNDLVSLQLATSSKPVKAEIFKPSQALKNHTAKILLNQYEPGEALRKVFDPTSNPTHGENGEEK